MRSRRTPPNILVIRIDGEDDPEKEQPRESSTSTPSPSKVGPSSTAFSSPLLPTSNVSPSSAAVAQLTMTAIPQRTSQTTPPVTPSPTATTVFTPSPPSTLIVEDNDRETVTVTAAPETISVTVAPTSQAGTATPLPDSSSAVPADMVRLSQTAVDVLIATGTLGKPVLLAFVYTPL